MTTGKAPSEGQKVTAGQNAPYTAAATGPVAPGSLAAESQAFTQSNEATPQHMPRENFTSASKSHQGTQATSTTTSDTQSAGQAPTYVNNQYHHDPSGPHGKNLKEDDSIATEDKQKNTSFSQFGTKDDPGAAAEQKFTSANASAAGPTGGRQKGLDGKTPYDALGSETSA